MRTLHENSYTRARRHSMWDGYAPFEVRPALRRGDRALWSERDDLKGVCRGALVLIILLLAIVFASKL